MNVLSENEMKEVESKVQEFTRNISINMFLDDSTVSELIAR
ncbi:hypothetical protein Vspart_04451 [Vibrio spartinae]|nr:hypothetical protein Vspart_04451 [Vibrio spartinae]